MDKAREFLEKKTAESSSISRLAFPPHNAHVQSSFYEYFVLRGIKVEKVLPGFVYCSFKVPQRLIDGNGNLSAGAIASLVDEMGAAVILEEGKPMDVSVDMSICYISAAKLNDELEIISRKLGSIGGYAGTLVLIRNKETGTVVAEGRHSLFSKPVPKM